MWKSLIEWEEETEIVRASRGVQHVKADNFLLLISSLYILNDEKFAVRVLYSLFESRRTRIFWMMSSRVAHIEYDNIIVVDFFYNSHQIRHLRILFIIIMSFIWSICKSLSLTQCDH